MNYSIATVKVGPIRELDQDVGTAYAVGQVRRHNEGYIDLFLESGVPALSESFGKAAARSEINTRPAILESVNKIDLIAYFIQHSDLTVPQHLGTDAAFAAWVLARAQEQPQRSTCQGTVPGSQFRVLDVSDQSESNWLRGEIMVRGAESQLARRAPVR